MGDTLDLTVDKFTFRIATDRRYTEDGLWVLELEPGGGRLRIGLSDFLQKRSGDVAFVTVNRPATVIDRGDELAEVETIKVTIGLPSPVGCSVLAVNGALDATPELVNQQPYGDGWLAEVEATDWTGATGTLLEPTAYLETVRTQAQDVLEKP